MAVDRHVIGWIREDHVRAPVSHQVRQDGGVLGVTAMERVPAHDPVIAGPGYGGGAGLRAEILRSRRFGRRPVGVGQDQVDLRELEARKRDVESQVRQPLKLDRQNLHVPAGVQSQFVISDDIGALLGVRHVTQANTGNECQADPLSRGPPVRDRR